MRTMTKVGSAFLALSLLTGCASMTAEQQREVKEEAKDSLAGGAAGAAGGATLGAIAGSAAIGAAILGPIGLMAGLAYYEYYDSKHSKAASKNGQSKDQ